MLESLFILLPISLVFVFLMGVAFWWAIFAGQFDNSKSAGESILLDDDDTRSSSEEVNKH
ncbi:cbb3-type cytochrome oxidase assembly protein CcoS [Paenalcaligenes niemegkensis]|uniref:cbb3-type cytochrome oxidase assembly protein CcoS n=1 Tax=Paenalcaligenes niemegkensis TaxID=2895469 RepID=UPI001EE7F5CA|nr:cbb3-type cytochrome oxidase assembly protein CcoS [Paenalcaligenes niemegkensis]MCQ9616765.1 cbb3-type cytochrome oxidase assembly protein CcoS [Paenalcaligenes niemegkensis]